MEVQRQFTLVPEGTRQGETYFNMDLFPPGFKNGNPPMQGSM
jgi:hypothetical protein